VRWYVSASAVLVSAGLSLTGCSSPSPQERINDACADVKKVVDAQRKLGPDDNGTAFIPVIDKEYAAARKAQAHFAAANAAADFTAAWNNMLSAMWGNRKAWQNVTPWRGAPGTEMIGTLNLAEAKTKLDEAKKSLNAAAHKHEYTTCAAITWQY
jgi:hypothetical protein